MERRTWSFWAPPLPLLLRWKLYAVSVKPVRDIKHTSMARGIPRLTAAVQQIVYHVGGIKGIDGGWVLVRGRGTSRVEGVYIVVGRRALRGRADGRRRLVREDIVTGSRGRRGSTVLVPAVRGRGSVMGVGQSLETVGWALRCKGNDGVLYAWWVRCVWGLGNNPSTHASVSNEGHNVDDLARSRIDKRLVPLLSLVVLDLDNVRKDDVV
jgi:hypothetical protein